MLKLKDGFIIREIAGEAIAMPMKKEMGDVVVSLSESAAVIWRMLVKGAEMDDLVNAMLESYEIDEETARAHVQELITQMKEKNFLA